MKDGNALQELNTGIHVAGVANVDEAELLNFFGFLNHHGVDVFELSGFFEFVADAGAHDEKGGAIRNS